MARKWALRSLRDSSVVLKFHVFFVVMSLLPLTILFYLYWQIKESGQIPVSVDELNNVLLLVSVGILVGYFSMRMLLKGLVDVVHSSTRRLKEILGPQALQDVLKADEDEIEALTQSFNEVTARLMENVSDLEATRKTLRSVLIRVGHGGVGVSSITAFFDLIVETITNALDGRKGFLLVVDDEKGGLIPRATYGVPLKSLEGVRVPLDSGIFLPVLQGRMTAIIPGVSNVHGQELLSGLLEYPLICAPLLVNDRVSGILVVCGRKQGAGFREEEMRLLEDLAAQAAVALEHARLDVGMESACLETIAALALAVESRDPYARGHLSRVSDLAAHVARAMDLPDGDVLRLKDAARIYDVGKIGILEGVLSKPDPLSDEEKGMVRRYPEVSESMVRPFPSLDPLRDTIRHHREFLDGTGYPDGIRGDAVLLPARILGVVDIFDALLRDTPYRKALAIPDAERELRSMGEKIDQKVVDALMAVVRRPS